VGFVVLGPLGLIYGLLVPVYLVAQLGNGGEGAWHGADVEQKRSQYPRWMLTGAPPESSYRPPFPNSRAREEREESEGVSFR